MVRTKNILKYFLTAFLKYLMGIMRFSLQTFIQNSNHLWPTFWFNCHQTHHCWPTFASAQQNFFLGLFNFSRQETKYQNNRNYWQNVPQLYWLLTDKVNIISSILGFSDYRLPLCYFGNRLEIFPLLKNKYVLLHWL